MASSMYLCALIITLEGVFASNSATGRRHFYEVLFHAYDKHIKPEEGKAASVSHQLILNRIVDFDVHKQLLTLDVWVKIHWHDDRLVWDPATSGVESLLLEPKRLWMPDFVIYNSAGPPTAKLQTSAHVNHTGDITYIPAGVTKTYCDVTEPIRVGDHVTCKVIIGSWLYDDKDVDIQMWDVHMDTTNFEDTNPDWSLDSTSVERKVQSYPCCPGHNYPRLVYSLDLVKKNRPCL